MKLPRWPNGWRMRLLNIKSRVRICAEPVYAHTLVHCNISRVVGWHQSYSAEEGWWPLATVAEIG